MVDLKFDDRLYAIEGMITSEINTYDDHDHYVYNFFVKQNYLNRETIEVTICSKEEPDFKQGDLIRAKGYNVDELEFQAKKVKKI